MVTGAVPGGILGTYGFFNLKAGAVDIAIFFFVSGFTLFAALVRSVKSAIAQVLADKNRRVEETLPEQLRLFEVFYAESS